MQVGLGITYSVTGGQALYHFWGLTCKKEYTEPDKYPHGHCPIAFGQSAWIIVYGGVQLFLIQAS